MQKRIAPPVGATNRTTALGPSSPCANNPCDPYCHDFDEFPDGGPIGADVEPPAIPWQTGSVSGLPPGLANKGLQEPCQTGDDCQFNHRCTAVDTDSACGASKCKPGGLFDASCDPCVSEVCAADPSCCVPGGACAHDPCQVGTKLAKNCDSCVNAVCTGAFNYCCTSGSWDAACVNQAIAVCGLECPCQPDEVTSPDRQSCYQVETSTLGWAAARTACVNKGNGYDLATVDGLQENAFLMSILPSSWTWIGYNDIATEGDYSWSSGSSSTFTSWLDGQPDDCCNTNPDCAQYYNGTATSFKGVWDDWSCDDASYNSVCERPANPNAPVWEQRCVDQVATVCDAECSTDTPLDESGQCVPWQPGETDADCTGVDLGAGVPCDDPTDGPIIPVCNHGQTTAPAGIRIIHYPANSNQYPACAPAQTHPQMFECFTSESIPPGECISVTGCPQLVGNREIMVNPPGAGAVAECSCKDNWTLYNAGACGPPACVGVTSRGNLRPLNMIVVMDRSGSMASGNRWSGASTAMAAFFEDSASAGIDVALEFFPLAVTGSTGDGCAPSSTTCGAAACSNPMVPLGTLQSASAPTDAHEAALVAALSDPAVDPPNGGTPSYPAADGALQWAKTQQVAEPDEAYAFVFVTDGDPTECLQTSTPNTNNEIRILAEDAFDDNGIRTYTIGMTGANIPALDDIAASGGTSSAFVIGNGTATQIASDLLAALQAIAGQAAACSFPLSNPGGFDPDSAVVTHSSSSGMSTSLVRRDDATTCGGGWYYDDNVNPTQVNLCPSTCAAVQGDPGASVDVTLGCSGQFATSTFTEVYESACEQDEQAVWTFFSYDTSTGSDSSVQFRARSAHTRSELTTAPYVDVATAQASPDTQICAMTGPAPCPIDLTSMALLGSQSPGPAADLLELEITLNPSSNLQVSPDLNDWRITYSCQPAE